MSDAHPFGAAEDVVEQSSPYGEPLSGYTPGRRWVRNPLTGKSVPRELIEAQKGRPMTTTSIERVSDTPTVTAEQLALVKTTVAPTATADELKLFLFDCARQGVHPLDRLVHFTKRSGKYTPITSIDFMRIRAADSGEMAGSDDPRFDGVIGGDVPPMSATVTVYRMTQGQRFAYSATARWSEYKPEQNDFMWKKMPHTMLGKCAEALALRKGFPRQLAGLYAKEEMDQAGAEPVIQIRETPAPKHAKPEVFSPNAATGARSSLTTVRAVTMNHGKTATGREYDLYVVAFEDGREASTFSADLALAAESARDAKLPVDPVLMPAKRAGKFDLKALQVPDEDLAGTKWTPEQLENQSL